MVNSPLIRPAIYWGGSFGGGVARIPKPFKNHDLTFKLHLCRNGPTKIPLRSLLRLGHEIRRKMGKKNESE